MVRDNSYDNSYLFGATCHARGKVSATIIFAANTECINLHLQETSTKLSHTARAALMRERTG